MRYGIITTSLALALSVLISCGEYHDVSGEDYGNISAGPSGIILVQSEHQVGWGKSDCFECHGAENIHQEDRSGTGLNLEAIRDLTRAEGLASCPICHGSNGVLETRD